MDFEDAHFWVRCMRYRFRTEKLPLKTLMRLDLNGATVIDIGANKGIYCYWLSRAVGGSGKVMAFEPQPEMINYIRDRKQSFALDNVEIIPTALSDRHGTAQRGHPAVRRIYPVVSGLPRMPRRETDRRRAWSAWASRARPQSCEAMET